MIFKAFNWKVNKVRMKTVRGGTQKRQVDYLSLRTESFSGPTAPPDFFLSMVPQS